MYNMQNCSGGVNLDCVAANPGQEWMCFFAQVSLVMSCYSRMFDRDSCELILRQANALSVCLMSCL